MLTPLFVAFVVGLIIGAVDALFVYKYGITGEWTATPEKGLRYIGAVVGLGLVLIVPLGAIPGITLDQVANGLVAHTVLILIGQAIRWWKSRKGA